MDPDDVMRVDIRSEYLGLGFWRARAVSFKYDESKEPKPAGALDLEVPAYDFGGVRWFYARSADRAEDKATTWATKQVHASEPANVVTRDVRLK